MGFVPEITCRHCGTKYSALHQRCPQCGTRRVKRSSRTPATSASVREGTAAAARAGSNTQFQFIFGVVLIVAVIVAVIVLISAGIKAPADIPERPVVPSEDIPTTPAVAATPTLPPEPTPSPTPPVSSIAVTFLGNPLTAGEFSCYIGDVTDLDATVYPMELGIEAEWTSTDESVCTVDADGKVTAVGSGTAKVIASCGAVSVEIIVRVW